VLGADLLGGSDLIAEVQECAARTPDDVAIGGAEGFGVWELCGPMLKGIRKVDVSLGERVASRGGVREEFIPRDPVLGQALKAIDELGDVGQAEGLRPAFAEGVEFFAGECAQSQIGEVGHEEEPELGVGGGLGEGLAGDGDEGPVPALRAEREDLGECDGRRRRGVGAHMGEIGQTRAWGPNPAAWAGFGPIRGR